MHITTVMSMISAAMAVANGASIDSGGFSYDGRTTYCEGVADSAVANTLWFDNLEAFNSGRCPVSLTMTSDTTTVEANQELTVSLQSQGVPNLQGSIFPNALDPNTQIPPPINNMLVTACLAGTECGTTVESTPGAGAEAAMGAYPPDGPKDLGSYKLTFQDDGDYIIVGMIVLPGDPSLQLAFTEYVSFLEVTVGNGGSSNSSSSDALETDSQSISGMVSTDASGKTSGDGSGMVSTDASGKASGDGSGMVSTDASGKASGDGSDITDVGTVSPTGSNSAVPKTIVKPETSFNPKETSSAASSDSDSNAEADTKSKKSSSFISENTALVAILVAGAGVVAIAAFMLVMSKKRRDMHEKGSPRAYIPNPRSRNRTDMNPTVPSMRYLESTSTRLSKQSRGTSVLHDSVGGGAYPAEHRGSEMASSTENDDGYGNYSNKETRPSPNFAVPVADKPDYTTSPPRMSAASDLSSLKSEDYSNQGSLPQTSAGHLGGSFVSSNWSRSDYSRESDTPTLDLPNARLSEEYNQYRKTGKSIDFGSASSGNWANSSALSAQNKLVSSSDASSGNNAFRQSNSSTDFKSSQLSFGHSESSGFRSTQNSFNQSSSSGFRSGQNSMNQSSSTGFRSTQDSFGQSMADGFRPTGDSFGERESSMSDARYSSQVFSDVRQSRSASADSYNSYGTDRMSSRAGSVISDLSNDDNASNRS